MWPKIEYEVDTLVQCRFGLHRVYVKNNKMYSNRKFDDKENWDEVTIGFRVAPASLPPQCYKKFPPKNIFYWKQLFFVVHCAYRQLRKYALHMKMFLILKLLEKQRTSSCTLFRRKACQEVLTVSTAVALFSCDRSAYSGRAPGIPDVVGGLDVDVGLLMLTLELSA